MRFAIFADSPAAAAIAERTAPTAGGQLLRHASGRPWIVGHWQPADVIATSAGRHRIALLGCTRIDARTLPDTLGRARSLQELDALARTLPGAAHLVASVNGRVRAQGTVTGVCQIHYTQVDGTTIAADRPDLLAAMTGAGLREDLLARQLLAPLIPYPLGERPLWQGTEKVPGNSYLELTPDDAHRVVRWWTAPEPDLPLVQGAERLRSALHDAVAARTHLADTISADLSGGMDSTSLCFLAGDRGPARLVTHLWGARDSANDDQTWAEQAAAALPGAEHVVTHPDDLPLWYEDLMTPTEDAEGPFAWIRTQAQQLAQVRQAVAQGSSHHLTGHGGDELFAALPTYLHTLARTSPRRAWRLTRSHAAMFRWKSGPTLCALADNRSYGTWLAAAVDDLAAPPPRNSRPDFGWGVSFRMPAWATPDAVETVRGMLRDAALTEPLAPQRGQHLALEMAQECGNTIRRVSRMTSSLGVAWHAPFVDDRVVEAALSIRLLDRAETAQYKPPLAAAMRGIVPDRILGRPTKAEFSAEAYAGLRRHKHHLAELCDHLHLADKGLVDPDAFRAGLLGLHPGSLTMIPLDATLACESWLRSVTTTAPSPALPGGHR
ncbi:asparagine synthase [Streptomyces atratus]|uniref:asparagine synthase-related protein n=1 Tax=Streptomyces atratus TaxID=1893 RepID=UPI00166FE7E4|nr:asparagine synthase-related protein [Streptomyces atratus]GGT76022.1 asparagine synthase [Streptomyces atratus]